MSSTKQPITPSTSSLAVAATVDSSSAFAAAYERRLPEMMALRESELGMLNVQPYTAVTTVLGTLQQIRSLREEISTLQSIDRALVDNLEDYARAAAEAHSRYLTARTPGADVRLLNREALKMRDLLRTDARALAKRALIDPARLASFKSYVGYQNVAFELMGYATLLRDCWPQIEGRTAVRKEEVEKARRLAEELVRAAGERKQGTVVVAAASSIRLRAMTLLLRSYNETRRAIGFLRRHEGDVDRIAPSLWAGRGGRGKVARMPTSEQRDTRGFS